MAEALHGARHVWDCRWSTVDHWFHANEHQEVEGLWVCVRRPDVRRAVTDEECANCRFWEPAWTRGPV